MYWIDSRGESWRRLCLINARGAQLRSNQLDSGNISVCAMIGQGDRWGFLESSEEPTIGENCRRDSDRIVTTTNMETSRGLEWPYDTVIGAADLRQGECRQLDLEGGTIFWAWEFFRGTKISSREGMFNDDAWRGTDGSRIGIPSWIGPKWNNDCWNNSLQVMRKVPANDYWHWKRWVWWRNTAEILSR